MEAHRQTYSDGGVGERHAYGEPIEFSLELREDERDGGGATR